MSLSLPIQPKLELPFKPFTLDEVKAMTGVSSTQLDKWCGMLIMRNGSGVTGLDYMQTLGVFVGCRWLHENAPQYLADGIMIAIASMTDGHLEHEISEGRTFPVCKAQMPSMQFAGIMVVAPGSSLGQRLRMDKLWAEFKENVKRLYPNG